MTATTAETGPMTDARLLEHAGIEVPLICGAMYPCSNPELVAAVSEAGGIGILQPVSLTYVYGYDFREGLRRIRSLTARPVGMNALIERSSRRYHEKMVQWVDVALEEGIRFFITSLGNPRWVCERVHREGGRVYHDVTERKWALKGRDAGVDGLIGVNRRAGGHPGPRSAEELFAEVHDLGLPVVAAGGIGDAKGFAAAIRIGYAGVQMGTRFIATTECGASDAYKQAILAGGRGRHRPERADHRGSGRGDQYAAGAAQRTQGGRFGAVDAPGRPDQTLDPNLVRAQVLLAAQAGLARSYRRKRVLAGGQECRGDRPDRRRG